MYSKCIEATAECAQTEHTLIASHHPKSCKWGGGGWRPMFRKVQSSHPSLLFYSFKTLLHDWKHVGRCSRHIFAMWMCLLCVWFGLWSQLEKVQLWADKHSRVMKLFFSLLLHRKSSVSVYPAAMSAREMEKSASGAYYWPPGATGCD